MPDPDLKPWERRPKESARAYAAFVVFRNLGPSRTLRAAYRQLSGNEQASQCSGEFSMRAVRFRWQERANAWDDHLQAERDRVAAEESAKWERRRLQNQEDVYLDAMRLREKARSMIEYPHLRRTLEREERDPDGRVVRQFFTIEPARWGFGTVAQMLTLAAQMSNAVLTATSKDPADMSDAEITGVLSAFDQPSEGGTHEPSND